MGSYSVVIRPQYEELAQKLSGAMIWIDNPDRTKFEIDQWFNAYQRLFDEVTMLERRERREANK